MPGAWVTSHIIPWAPPMPRAPPSSPMRTDSATTSPITCRLVKPERLEHGDLGAPLAHGDAHGVRDDERGS